MKNYLKIILLSVLLALSFNAGEAYSGSKLATETYVQTGVATIQNKSISGSANVITNVSLTTGVVGLLPVANGGSGFAVTPPGSISGFTWLNQGGDTVADGTNGPRFVEPGVASASIKLHGLYTTLTGGATAYVEAAFRRTISLTGSPGTTILPGIGVLMYESATDKVAGIQYQTELATP